LDFTGYYARKHPNQRVVWFSDVSRLLRDNGDSWDNFGVDWERALIQIAELPILGLYMTINQRTHFHILNAVTNFTIHHLDGTSELLAEEEREAVRRSIEQLLSKDWPPFIRAKLEMGTLTFG
jgi:hypothetical protein